FRLPCYLFALSLFSLAFASPTRLEARDADFYHVRTRLMKDHSGKRGDPPAKYFHESTVSTMTPASTIPKPTLPPSLSASPLNMPTDPIAVPPALRRPLRRPHPPGSRAAHRAHRHAAR